MHKLIEHVESRLEELKAKGRSDAALERSAIVYREKLLEVGLNLCKED